jgi:probable rRNA maturation factor
MRASGRKPKAANPIAIVIEAPAWRAAGVAALIRRAAKCALDEAAAQGGLTVLLADDEALRRLNREFRGKDKPTNVLSFPAAANPEGHLGDIAIAHGVAAAEAKAGAKSLADHAAHLTVHGVLHLLGHDHEREDEADAMERLETKILARLGIADPYLLREAA